MTRPPPHLPGVSVGVDWFGGLLESHLRGIQALLQGYGTSFYGFED
jgi:hypothetical protein